MKFPKLEPIEQSAIRRIYQKARADSIDLGLGMPFSTTPNEVKKAATNAIENNKTFYTTNQGLLPLREMIASRYSEEKNIHLSADNVIINIGVAQAIFQSMFSVLQPGDEVLIPDPGYPAFINIAKMLGSKPVAYPLFLDNAFSLMAQDLIPKITKKTKLIILNSPGNPTGGIHRLSELETLASRLKNTDIAILSDEVYSHLSYNDTPFPAPVHVVPLDRLIILSGVSKEFAMTGWRIGWTISTKENINELLKTHLYMVSCASAISQHAALYALQSHNVETHEAMAINHKIVIQGLEKIPKIRYMIPQAGIYFFIDVSDFGAADDLAYEILEQKNVITIPGGAFGVNGKNFLRLSFGAPPDALEKGMEQLRQFFLNKNNPILT